VWCSGEVISASPAVTAVGDRSPGPLAPGKGNRVPTPEQWAREQLKNAPQRSQKWARKVAAIYGLDIAEKE
jgi:hypothetical protein